MLMLIVRIIEISSLHRAPFGRCFSWAMAVDGLETVALAGGQSGRDQQGVLLDLFGSRQIDGPVEQD